MPLTEYVKKLKEYFSEENDVEQKIVNALKETMLESFIDGEEYADTSSKLIKCIQLSINYERKNYILVDGDWYVVYEGLEKKLNSELPKLIRGRKPSFALPKWESHLSEDEYLNVLTGIPYNHAKLHRKRPLDSKTSKVFSKVYFYKNRGINFQDIPPKNGSFVAIDEDIFFEALSFASFQDY